MEGLAARGPVVSLSMVDVLSIRHFHPQSTEVVSCDMSFGNIPLQLGTKCELHDNQKPSAFGAFGGGRTGEGAKADSKGYAKRLLTNQTGGYPIPIGFNLTSLISPAS